MSDRTTLVIAGDYAQFKYWQRQGVVPVDAKYIKEPHDLFGHDDRTAVLIEVGTPWTRRDYYELVQCARSRGLEPTRKGG